MLAIDYRPQVEQYPDRVKTDDPANLSLTVVIPQPAETWFNHPATYEVLNNMYATSKEGSLAVAIAQDLETLKNTFNPEIFSSVIGAILQYDHSQQLYMDIIHMIGAAVDSAYTTKKLEFFETMYHVFNNEKEAPSESVEPDTNKDDSDGVEESVEETPEVSKENEG